MAGRELAAIDPVLPPPWRIGSEAKIVTAGSCFAQHVARHLRDQGYPLFETEPAHPLMPARLAEAYGYGVYAARYGNIYTSRQLLQLWRRATGRMQPVEDCWQQDGGWFDPFRPTIQPGGFSSMREYTEDRRQHFAAVRRAFSEMDVFVFTLGLTECWVSRLDGAAYPVCPGVAAGRFDAERHVLVNLGVQEVVEDLRAFISEVRAIKPRLRLILTVSPVPLAATLGRLLGQPPASALRDLGLFPEYAVGIPHPDRRRTPRLRRARGGSTIRAWPTGPACRPQGRGP